MDGVSSGKSQSKMNDLMVAQFQESPTFPSYINECPTTFPPHPISSHPPSPPATTFITMKACADRKRFASSVKACCSFATRSKRSSRSSRNVLVVERLFRSSVGEPRGGSTPPEKPMGFPGKPWDVGQIWTCFWENLGENRPFYDAAPEDLEWEKIGFWPRNWTSPWDPLFILGDSSNRIW